LLPLLLLLSLLLLLQLATQIVGSLLALEAMDEEEEIRMYINSSGGQPYSVIGVVDAMQVGGSSSSSSSKVSD
jgi:ATP-dependent Clp protease protease subunit